MMRYRDGRRWPGLFAMLVRYPVEALLVALLIFVLWLLPLDAASALGGRLARKLGPRLGVHRRAARSLTRIMPELDDTARQHVLDEMWDNLGRVIAEYPHLKRIWREADQRIELLGQEHLTALREDGKPGIMVTAHMGNWEIAPVGAAALGLDPGVLFRRPNNPYVNALLQWLRRSASGARFYAKGTDGARRALGHLKAGGHLGILADQKLNDGIAVPFFGVPAMTAPAVASFALRYRCPVVPVHIERLEGCRFRIIAEAPLALPDSGTRQQDVLALMTTINRHIEGWVRQRPGQWLWLHQRWPAEQTEASTPAQSST